MGVQSWGLYILGVVVIEWATYYHYGFARPAFRMPIRSFPSARIAPKTADTDSHGFHWSGKFSDLV